MVNEFEYISIRRVLDNLLEHPMLSNVSLEQAVRYALRFIQLHGYPKLFTDKVENVDIHEFRGLLPCDLVSIIQVKDLGTGICLRDMTDTFTPALVHDEMKKMPEARPLPKDLTNNMVPPITDLYIPPTRLHVEELAFKTQGRCIFTSFPEGIVTIAYKSTPVDDDGFPMLINNENFLAALEAYIKLKVFTIKFDMGDISSAVLQNAQQEYAWAAGTLDATFNIPSVSEMESITRMINTLIPNVTAFDRGFVSAGDREYLRRH